jgi:TRAP-type C4-dicarboxylate transport system permease small subunit
MNSDGIGRRSGSGAPSEAPVEGWDEVDRRALGGPPPSAPVKGWMETAGAWVCGLALMVTLAITAVEVFTRAVFNYSFQISDDLGGYLLVAITFLSLAYGQVTNAFHKVQFVQDRLQPRPRAILNLFFLVVAIFSVAAITWFLTVFAIDAFKSGDVAPTNLQTPMWIPQSIMPLGMAMLLVALIKTAIVEFRAFRSGQLPPSSQEH